MSARGGKLAGWLLAVLRIIAADGAGSWVWRGVPPTLAEMIAARIPDRSRVPGENVALWVGWIVFNHVVIAVAAPIYAVLWVLAHPARLALAVIVAAPLAWIWMA